MADPNPCWPACYPCDLLTCFYCTFMSNLKVKMQCLRAQKKLKIKTPKTSNGWRMGRECSHLQPVTRGPENLRKLPQRGPGRRTARKRILVNFSCENSSGVRFTKYLKICPRKINRKSVIISPLVISYDVHVSYKNRGITGRTARCRCTFRCVEFYDGIVWFLCHSTHFLLVFVCRLQWIICQKVTSRPTRRKNQSDSVVNADK